MQNDASLERLVHRRSFEDVLLVGAKPLVKSRYTIGPSPPPTAPAPPLYKSPLGASLLPRSHSDRGLGNAKRVASLGSLCITPNDFDHLSDTASEPTLIDECVPEEDVEASGRAFGLGLLLANVSTVSFSLQMLCVKLASNYGPPSNELLLVRFTLHSLATLACCAMKLFGFHGKFWKFANRRSIILCAGTGIFNTLVVQLLYFATTHLSLALATVLYFTSPVWSGILKSVLLGDAYSWADGGFSILTVFAVALVSFTHDPTTGGDSSSNGSGGSTFLVGLFAALAAGALQALAYVIVQLLRRTEEEALISPEERVHWLQINVSNAVFGVLVTPLALWGPLSFQKPTALLDLAVIAKLELLGVGGFTICAQFLLVQSQGYLDATLVTVIRSLDVMYALFYQTIFFSHQLPATSVALGCLLLIASVSGSAWYSRWSTKKLLERASEDKK